MNEVELLRAAFTDVSEPSVEKVAAARAALLDLIASDASGGAAAPATLWGRIRAGLFPGAVRLLLAGATLAIGTVAALFLTSPWSGSPGLGFLARAQAALTPPAGAVLHEKWVLAPLPDCPLRQEAWIDERPPYRFRLLMNRVLPQFTCRPGVVSEVGGAWPMSSVTLVFEPPNTLRRGLANQPSGIHLQPDPVADLREAISVGTATDQGKRRLHGRTVELICVDDSVHPAVGSDHASACPYRTCPRGGEVFNYVDPKTYYPVEIDGPCRRSAVPGHPAVWRPVQVLRYQTFEYLPRTAGNLALTNIRAQHPRATVAD